MIEELEARQLLSVSLSNGVVNVAGTNKSDVVFVQAVYRDNAKDLLNVRLNGTTRTFELEDVRRISISVGNGEDRVTIDGNVFLDSYISGGNGKDTLVGGSGRDTIYGGNGKDLIKGMAGNDRLFGENAPDTIYGGDGDDYLSGGHGPDSLNGGPGRNTLV